MVKSKNKTGWYMVRCTTGKEKKAIENLNFEIDFHNLKSYVDDIVCPMEKQYFMRTDSNGNKKKSEKNKVMFPGYILIKMREMGELSRVIQQTNYVVEIVGDKVGTSIVPKPITEKEVNRIFSNVEKSKDTEEFFTGESIKIIDGPFSGFDATINEIIKSKDKIKVEVMVFGRAQNVEVGYLQVEKK
jgi:transcriptional antiterminator NusG